MENTQAHRRRQPRWSRFVFTLNNYTEQEWTELQETAKQTHWWIMGKEVAPATGTPHLQGACVIGKQVALSTLKRWNGLQRAHLEEMKGSPLDSQKYCSKDGDFYEWGKSPKPGERTDLIRVAAKIIAGATVQSLALDPDTAPMVVKYSKGLTALRSYCIPPRDPSKPPQIIWIHGPTGTNKTRTAFEAARQLYPDAEPWISSGSLQWFDGYEGQPVAILDDLRTRHCSFNFLLQLLDRYPFRVPIKGSMGEWVPRVIFVTAPYGSSRMWNLKTPEDVAQLTRRITLEVLAPEELSRVYELLCLPYDPVVVSVLPGTPEQPVRVLDRGDDLELSFRELLGGRWDDNEDYYSEVPKTVPYFSDEER